LPELEGTYAKLRQIFGHLKLDFLSAIVSEVQETIESKKQPAVPRRVPRNPHLRSSM